MNDSPLNFEPLIGLTVEQAIAQLREWAKGFMVVPIVEGTITTLEYRSNRIRVWYNVDTNLVSGITTG